MAGVRLYKHHSTIGEIMSKKDRIAIVVSVLYFLFPLALLFDDASDAPIVAIVFISPLIAYWGYRFIKGDISFLKNDGSEEP